MTGPTVWAVVAAAVPVVALGPWASRRRSTVRAPGPTGRPGGRRSGARRRLPAAAVLLPVTVPAVIAGLAGWPVPLVVAGTALLLWGRARTVGRRLAHERRAVARAAPDVVDLLALAAAAGHPPHRCLRLVAERSPPEVRGAFVDACRRLDRGVPLVDAVGALRVGLGPLGDPVADALVDAFRTGAALGPALDRVGAAARDGRRRAAEAEARRLPVLLLFPLVCCVLPAFGLLAVVPLVAASVRSLS